MTHYLTNRTVNILYNQNAKRIPQTTCQCALSKFHLLQTKLLQENARDEQHRAQNVLPTAPSVTTNSPLGPLYIYVFYRTTLLMSTTNT